jgi:hypothetical protein
MPSWACSIAGSNIAAAAIKAPPTMAFEHLYRRNLALLSLAYRSVEFVLPSKIGNLAMLLAMSLASSSVSALAIAASR